MHEASIVPSSRKFELWLTILGALSGSLMLAIPAQAVTDTAYVAPKTGSDGNTGTNCGAAAPCQTLTAALSVSPKSVQIIEPGTFSPISITTALSIGCPVGGCTFDGSGGGAAITINASGSSVSLSGFLISSFGTAGTTGVLVTDVGKLELKNMTISGSDVGIQFSPTSGNSHLYLLNSEIKNAAVRNVLVQPTGSGSASAVFTGVKMHHGSSGFRADATTTTGGVSVNIVDSVISFASTNNVAAVAAGAGCSGSPTGATGPFARVLIERSVISYGGGNGVNANGCGAQILIDSTMTTQNAIAWIAQNTGLISTMGNNALFNNATNSSVVGGGAIVLRSPCSASFGGGLC